MFNAAVSHRTILDVKRLLIKREMVSRQTGCVYHTWKFVEAFIQVGRRESGGYETTFEGPGRAEAFFKNELNSVVLGSTTARKTKTSQTESKNSERRRLWHGRATMQGEPATQAEGNGSRAGRDFAGDTHGNLPGVVRAHDFREAKRKRQRAGPVTRRPSPISNMNAINEDGPI